jgi:hypothetical protein
VKGKCGLKITGINERNFEAQILKRSGKIAILTDEWDGLEIHFPDDPDFLVIKTNGEIVLNKQVFATGAFLSHTLCKKGLIPL